MTISRWAVVVVAVLVGVAVLVWASPGRPQLSEDEIKATLEGLPYDYRYQAREYSGGALVVATAYKGKTATHFAVLSGDPQWEGRLMPRGFIEQVGIGGGETSVNDLFIRTAVTEKSNIGVQVEIESALCAERMGHECGV